jgi:alanine dehydrogenase
MPENETLIFTRYDVSRLLRLDECMNAVEHAFKLYAEGKAVPPKVLGLHTENGGFHIKAGMLNLQRNYFVTKINSNFPANQKQFGLPLIQGIVAVFDGDNGKLLALLDSIGITIIRTGAATGVAAKYLAKKDAKTAIICGCGNQGSISLKAIKEVRQLEKVFAFDINKDQAIRFADELSKELTIQVEAVDDINPALSQSDICVTCTTSTRYFIETKDVLPGTFIAAVGADSEHKQEIQPELIASCKLVVDIMEQASTIGELHHALQAQLITIDKVYAELGDIIAGKKQGRQSDNEIIVFDSTGTALQDVAAAAIVYERGLENKFGMKLNFNEPENSRVYADTQKRQKMISALLNFYPFR